MFTKRARGDADTDEVLPGDERLVRDRCNKVLLAVLVVLAAAAIASGASTGTVVVAALMAWAIFRSGFAILGGMARPIPEPPPVGELRKVKILYRCSLCGAEVRMTVAPDEDPQPPRHCMEDMDLTAPTME